MFIKGGGFRPWFIVARSWQVTEYGSIHWSAWPRGSGYVMVSSIARLSAHPDERCTMSGLYHERSVS